MYREYRTDGSVQNFTHIILYALPPPRPPAAKGRAQSAEQRRPKLRDRLFKLSKSNKRKRKEVKRKRKREKEKRTGVLMFSFYMCKTTYAAFIELYTILYTSS